MDLLSEITHSSKYLTLWFAFLAGIGGSIHCVSMCGGLVTACSTGRTSNMTYQLGRVLSYSIIGLCAGLFGSFFTQLNTHPFITVIPALLIGFMFIFWGIKSLKGNPLKIKIPLIIKKIWNKFLKINSPRLRSFSVGSLSIFLPCGLLYGVILALASFQSPMIGFLGMIFFWLGTLPAMMLAPEIFYKIFRPILKKSSVMTSIILTTIGISTITYRLVIWYGTNGQSCH